MARVHMERFVKELEALCEEHGVIIYQASQKGREYNDLIMNVGMQEYEVLSISKDMNVSRIKEVE